MTIQITGTLDRDAQYCLSGTHTAVVQVMFRTEDPACWPFQVSLFYSDRHAEAEAVARSLVRGDRVVGTARRIELITDHGERRLALRGAAALRRASV